MSDFFDKSPEELLNEKPTTTPAKTLDDVMREIILADMETMKKFGRAKTHIVYPQSVRPRWKN